MASEVINKISQKLGINNTNTITKACEHIRNVNAKSKIAINEMLKAIICLDIASAQLEEKFDKAAALKLAVVTKPQYQKNYLLFKKLLQVESNKSIHEICIQLSCEEASKSAEILLNKYKEHDCINKDFNHPQYAVGAVYTICKLQKISIKKADFVSLSTLKPQQWTKLESEFSKFVEEQNFTVHMVKKSTKKKGNEYLNILEQKSMEIAKENEIQKNTDVEVTESYESWRKRILEEAYAHTQNI